VRIDVLMCFSRLLDTAAAADARRGGSRRSSSAVVVVGAAAGEVGKAAAAAQQAGRGARAVDTLRSKLPAIVKAAQRQVSPTANLRILASCINFLDTVLPALCCCCRRQWQ
jgi:ribosomal protein S5